MTNPYDRPRIYVNWQRVRPVGWRGWVSAIALIALSIAALALIALIASTLFVIALIVGIGAAAAFFIGNLFRRGKREVVPYRATQMLEIKDLHATVDGKKILNGLTLSIGSGEVHAIMGPNGSGKSTLSYVLAGRPGYEVTSGTVTFRRQNLLEMKPEERAAAGVFLALQYPVEIPGVTTINFLRTALNAQAKARGELELDAVTFLRRLKDEREKLSMPDDMVKRAVNVGFSGGEKKRNEVLQMAMLKPSLAILDETDSGLDIDALKLVAQGVNALREPTRSFLVITHYQRLLDYIVPHRVHVLAAGRIAKSGGPELAHELEAKGYDAIVREPA